MSYHIARVIIQRKVKEVTFLYFADGTVGYISSKVNIKDFCVVSDDPYEHGKYLYVDNLENIEIKVLPFSARQYKPSHIDIKNDFAIILFERESNDVYDSHSLFPYGVFYSTQEKDNVDDEEFWDDYYLSDSDLKVLEEKYFPQYTCHSLPYYEITPNLLTELLKSATDWVDSLNINDIIDSFVIEGKLKRNCKAGHDVDWTDDVASMESHIQYSDSYIEHILPPQRYWKVISDNSDEFFPSFFYRDDLDSYLAEKAENMKSKARFVYSRKEHIMYFFHGQLMTILNSNAEHKKKKEIVHDNYIKYWQTNYDDDVDFDNKATQRWTSAACLVQSEIKEVNFREMLFEHNKSVLLHKSEKCYNGSK